MGREGSLNKVPHGVGCCHGPPEWNPARAPQKTVGKTVSESSPGEGLHHLPAVSPGEEEASGLWKPDKASFPGGWWAGGHGASCTETSGGPMG